jgi:hypothetical protein
MSSQWRQKLLLDESLEQEIFSAMTRLAIKEALERFHHS